MQLASNPLTMGKQSTKALTLTKIKYFLILSRPHFLVGAALMYALGAGISWFLGTAPNWGGYLLGQLWILFIQLSTHFFNEYYDFHLDQQNNNRTPFSGGSGALGPNKLPREIALWAGITSLTVAASLSVLVMRFVQLDLLVLFIMSLIFLGAILYSNPPVRLATSGYGELTTSIVVTILVPTLSFLLQAGELNRLLAMVTFPITFLHLAMMIVFEFPDYSSDIKHLKTTLLVRLGWERGIILHNLMILTSYLTLAIAAVLGLPFEIALPGFLTLPIGLFQMWMLHRIAEGEKPNWFLLTLTAVALLGVTTYLFAFTFWIRSIPFGIR